MTAAPMDLVIEQGTTFTLGFTWRRQAVNVNGDPILDAEGNPTPGDPYDLTGCIARMQIRRKQGDPVLVNATSDPPVDDAAIAAGAGRIVLGGPYVSDGAGGWTLDPTNGRIDITLTDEDTDMLSAKSAYYDLEIEWPIQPNEIRPRVDRLLQGAITTDPNITQVTPEDPVVS